MCLHVCLENTPHTVLVFSGNNKGGARCNDVGEVGSLTLTGLTGDYRDDQVIGEGAGE